MRLCIVNYKKVKKYNFTINDYSNYYYIYFIVNNPPKR